MNKFECAAHSLSISVLIMRQNAGNLITIVLFFMIDKRGWNYHSGLFQYTLDIDKKKSYFKK